jgi:hypothetical protein
MSIEKLPGQEDAIFASLVCRELLRQLAGQVLEMRKASKEKPARVF